MANENINPNLPSDSTFSEGAQRRKTYHLHVDVHPGYEPLQKRSKCSRLSHQEMEQRRRQGEHHLDLWTDGRLYPKDPTTNATPPFSNVTSLVHFTGDGKQGLLGYIQRIESKTLSMEKVIDAMSARNKVLSEQNQQYITRARSCEESIKELEKKLDTLRQKDTELGPRRRKRKLSNLHQLKLGSGGVKKRIHAVRLLFSLNRTSVFIP